MVRTLVSRANSQAAQNGCVLPWSNQRRQVLSPGYADYHRLHATLDRWAYAITQQCSWNTR